MKTEPWSQESSSPKEVYRTTNTVKLWFALEMNGQNEEACKHSLLSTN